MAIIKFKILPLQKQNIMNANSFTNYLKSSPLPLIGSHRGITDSLKKHKENTIESIFSHQNNKAHYAEFDLMCTKDNHLILFHDESIGSSLIEKTDFKTLLKLKPNLITLNELILTNTAQEKPLLLNIELKSYLLSAHQKKQFIEILLAELKTFNLTNKVLISSFDQDLLKFISIINSDCLLALLFEKSENFKINQNLLPHLTALCPHFNAIQDAQLYKLPNFIWETGSESHIFKKTQTLPSTSSFFNWIKSMNIYGLTTNHVSEINSIISP